MNINLTFQTITLAAYELRPVAITGSVFVCKSATARFKMRFDAGEEIDMDQGWSVVVGNEMWGRLVFINTTAAEITLSFYAGSNAMQYASQATTMSVKPVSTRLVVGGPSTISVLPAGTAYTIPGTNAGQIRKQIVITNLDGSRNLLIYAGPLLLDHACACVFPETAWTIESDVSLTIYNPDVSGMAVLILETYLTS